MLMEKQTFREYYCESVVAVEQLENVLLDETIKDFLAKPVEEIKKLAKKVYNSRLFKTIKNSEIVLKYIKKITGELGNSEAWVDPSDWNKLKTFLLDWFKILAQIGLFIPPGGGVAAVLLNKLFPKVRPSEWQKALA